MNITKKSGKHREVKREKESKTGNEFDRGREREIERYRNVEI